MNTLDQAFTAKSQVAAALTLLQSCTAYERYDELTQVGALLHDLKGKLDGLTETLGQ